MNVRMPPEYLPKVRTLATGVHVVAWLGDVVWQYDSLARAKASNKYLRYLLRRLAKCTQIDSAALGQQLQLFLSTAAQSTSGFNPPWNVV